MTRTQDRYFAPLFWFLDSLTVTLAYVASLPLYALLACRISSFTPLQGGAASLSFFMGNYTDALPFLAMLIVFLFRDRFKGDPGSTATWNRMALRAAAPCIVTLGILILFALVDTHWSAAFWPAIIFLFLSWVLLSLNRVLTALFFRFERHQGWFQKFLLIVGTDQEAEKVARIFGTNPRWGVTVAGFLTKDTREVGREILSHPVLGNIEDLSEVVSRRVVDAVFLASGLETVHQINSLGHRCRAIGLDFAMDFSGLIKDTGEASVESAGDLGFVAFRSVFYSPEKLFVKRIFDIILSICFITACLPVWLVVPVIIKIDSRGPVFYRQTRVGRNGRLFTLYKFRSMVSGAEELQQKLLHLNEMGGPVFKIKDDPRLTVFGKFLRRSSLDEIPQLFNVLRGNMSLVGPRPLPAHEVLQFHPWQRKRLAAVQGITCLWQVSGRNDIKFDEWVKLDLQYIENWSLTLDFKILLRTIPAVLSGRGAR
jgi:exopolysaccharide biosynthesis polyprenyl glycosylphosphotransferase